MLGLESSANTALLRSMADNYALLINTYGHIPNGNRSYYLGRSQPPVFALVVGLFDRCGVKSALHYLPQLRREHAFRMEGEEGLADRTAHRHVVKLPDGSLLNRYWDDRDTPRDGSYLEDVTAASKSQRDSTERESKLVEKYVLRTGFGEPQAAAENIRYRTASAGPTVWCGSCSTSIRSMTPTDAAPDGEGGGCRPESPHDGPATNLTIPARLNLERHPEPR